MCLTLTACVCKCESFRILNFCLAWLECSECAFTHTHYCKLSACCPLYIFKARTFWVGISILLIVVLFLVSLDNLLNCGRHGQDSFYFSPLNDNFDYIILIYFKKTKMEMETPMKRFICWAYWLISVTLALEKQAGGASRQVWGQRDFYETFDNYLRFYNISKFLFIFSPYMWYIVCLCVVCVCID